MILLRTFCIFLVCLFSLSAHADETSFFSSVYATVYNNHITPIEVEDFAVSGLKSLSRINKNFTISNGSDMIYLYFKNNVVAMSRKPQDKNDIEKWANITNSILKKAKNYSKTIKKSPSLAAERIVFYSVASLRDHSLYHFSTEKGKTQDEDVYADMITGETLYIKISSFSSDISQTIKQIYQDSNAQNIVLDLRGNRGGQINEAIGIAKLFIDEGIIVSTQGRAQSDEKYYVSEEKPIINVPLAVLIDRNTASSAEILASALQEQAQAILIGTTSFGKGSFQETYVFENGGKLALTVGRFFTPAGESIDHKGLSPDYCIINDMLYQIFPCPKQNRLNNWFDVDFAVQVLNSGMEDYF